jgi:serine/threonine protein kinase
MVRRVVRYDGILRQYGLFPAFRYPWATVGKVNRLQGWKLHVSSIGTEASELLERIVPLLVTSGVAFKVIRDSELLAYLNEGSLGATQVGKFVTVYPRSDPSARSLANRLTELTRGFHGPIITTDLRLGEVVYARYGGFNPIAIRDRLGQYTLFIRRRDGELRPDHYEVPFVILPEFRNPFEGVGGRREGIDFASGRSRPHSSPRSKLFGPGYLVEGVLKADPKGSVFRALDLRTQDHLAIRVLKQGRQWCLSDCYGRDMRSRLQHQELMHRKLCGLRSIPKAEEYFEVEGHGYLPLAYISGVPLVQLVGEALRNRSWAALSRSRQACLLGYLAEVVAAVGQMHEEGYVHRDLTGQNIFVGDDDSVYLLDLELAHAVGDPAPPFELGTVGFMSPQQEAREKPSFADDIYALGALLLLVLTGLDPRRAAFANSTARCRQWANLAMGSNPRLVHLASRCLEPRAWRRPQLSAFRAVLRSCVEALKVNKPKRAVRRLRLLGTDPGIMVRQGIHGLMQFSLTNKASGLWLSPAFGNEVRERAEGPRQYEIRRSANRGLAGGLYLLGRLARFGYGSDAVVAQARRIAHWLLQHSNAPDAGMPGLHFGEAGVAVALAEAVAGGLVERTAMLHAFWCKALSGILDWPDVTHGAAGQGIAALYCSDRLNSPELGALSARCAKYLIDTQRSDGSWLMPPGVDGLSGHVLTGFAHGVSGIVYFLSEYARRSADRSAQRAWSRGVEWILRKGKREGMAMVWPYSDHNPDTWKWWCHGSIGIALLFLRLHEWTQEVSYAEVARKALRVWPTDLTHPNLSQCHGLSGVGEVYLEAVRVLKDEEWRKRASSLLGTLENLRRQPHRRAAVWLVEDAYFPTADLMIGGGGVVHLWLRASLSHRTLGPPLLLDSVRPLDGR